VMISRQVRWSAGLAALSGLSVLGGVAGVPSGWLSARTAWIRV
jgi:hypothetical protein